jgi:hypothetical protein
MDRKKIDEFVSTLTDDELNHLLGHISNSRAIIPQWYLKQHLSDDVDFSKLLTRIKKDGEMLEFIDEKLKEHIHHLN